LAHGLGLDIQSADARSLEDFNQAFDRIVESHMEGVAVPADPLFF
jgi:hypothetical protein